MKLTQFWNQLQPNEFILVNEAICVNEYSEESLHWFEENKNTIWRVEAAIEDQGPLERRLLWSSCGEFKICPICLEDTCEDSKELSCKHVFHDKCITEWLKKAHTCPTCRHQETQSSDLVLSLEWIQFCDRNRYS